MLEVIHLTKLYKTKGGADVRALDDVSLRFPEKGMVFLLGRSGSGKSTLLKNVTSDYHYHTVTAEEERILDDVEVELAKRGYLVEQKKEELQ